MSTAKTKSPVVTDEMQRSRGWLCMLGILFVILGAVGLGMSVYLTLVSMLFIGILLAIGGVSQLIDAFKYKHWKGTLWHVLIALFYLVCGGIFIYDPFLASTFLTMFLGAMLIVIGTARLILAFTAEGWGLLLIAGLAAIVLGLMILMQWPYSGVWVIGLLIAIELIINGWTYIFIAVSMRRS